MSGALKIASGAAAIFGGIKAKRDAKSTARQQEQIANENALMIEAEAREQERRAIAQEDSVAARRRAIASASGTTGAGSQQIFMDDQATQFEQELDWLRKSTKSQADLTRKSGYSAARTTRNAGRSSFWQGIGTGGVSMARAGQDFGWWS